MRKYYLDNLRFIFILLLFPYHTVMIYNDFGENFYIRGESNAFLSKFIIITYPWFMPLLFVIAGISTYYALQKRTNKQYIKERVNKLLIPFISGILLLVPIQTYFAERFHNNYQGSYFYQYVLFFTKSTDLSGYTGGFTPAHLWFIIYLFIISLIALVFITLYKRSKYKINPEKITLVLIIPLFVVNAIMSLVLDISGKSIGEFLSLFLMGYFILSQDQVLDKLEKVKWYLLTSLILLTIVHLIFQYVLDFNSGNIFGLFEKLLSWIGILTFLAMGKSYLNFRNKVTDYLSKSSFPVYILHQSCLVFVAFYIFKLTSNIYYQVPLIIFLTLLLTYLVYEILKRIKYLRFIFGIKK